MLQRIEKTKSSLLDKILQNPNKKSWANRTKQLMKDINYKEPIDSEITNLSKTTMTKNVKESINKTFLRKINESGKEKSKTQYLLDGVISWSPGKRPAYMNMLNRDQVSIIFKARTRMLPVKNNFRNQHKDNKCRGCKADNETQLQVLQFCKEIHKDESTKVRPNQFFTDDIQTLKKAAENISLILTELVQSDVRPALTGNVTRPGTRTHTR
jgi:hypothetical protein